MVGGRPLAPVAPLSWHGADRQLSADRWVEGTIGVGRCLLWYERTSIPPSAPRNHPSRAFFAAKVAFAVDFAAREAYDRCIRKVGTRGAFSAPAQDGTEVGVHMEEKSREDVESSRALIISSEELLRLSRELIDRSHAAVALSHTRLAEADRALSIQTDQNIGAAGLEPSRPAELRR